MMKAHVKRNLGFQSPSGDWKQRQLSEGSMSNEEN
jgi:hypothetical protein